MYDGIYIQYFTDTEIENKNGNIIKYKLKYKDSHKIGKGYLYHKNKKIRKISCFEEFDDEKNIKRMYFNIDGKQIDKSEYFEKYEDGEDLDFDEEMSGDLYTEEYNIEEHNNEEYNIDEYSDLGINELSEEDEENIR